METVGLPAWESPIGAARAFWNRVDLGEQLEIQPTGLTGTSSSRTSIEQLLVVHGCFFEHTANWGYPKIPMGPRLLVGDLPRIDRQLKRFLQLAAAKFALSNIEFKPSIRRQRNDASKGQVEGQRIFDCILERLDHEVA